VRRLANTVSVDIACARHASRGRRVNALRGVASVLLRGLGGRDSTVLRSRRIIFVGKKLCKRQNFVSFAAPRGAGVSNVRESTGEI